MNEFMYVIKFPDNINELPLDEKKAYLISAILLNQELYIDRDTNIETALLSDDPSYSPKHSIVLDPLKIGSEFILINTSNIRKIQEELKTNILNDTDFETRYIKIYIATYLVELVHRNSADIVHQCNTSILEFEQNMSSLGERYNLKDFKELSDDLINTKTLVISDKLAMYNLFLSVDHQDTIKFDTNITISNTTKVCNPNFSKLNPSLNVMTLKDYEDLTKEKIDVKTLKKLQKSKLAINLIGLGGSNSCFWFFTEMIAKENGISNLFRTINVYENDSLEYSNLPRIPLDYISPQPNNFQSTYLECYRNISNKSKLRLLVHHCKGELSKDIRLYQRKLVYTDILSIDIFIGAPDKKTRSLLHDKQAMLYGLFHANDTVYLHTTPDTTDNIAYETYGRINLTTYFINMYVAVVNLLKLLAVHEDNEFIRNDIKLEYNFGNKFYSLHSGSNKYYIV